MSDDLQQRLLKRGQELFKREGEHAPQGPAQPEPSPTRADPGTPARPERASIAPVWIGDCLRLAGEAYAPTLVLRLRNGKRVALANSYFSAARLESGDQLELDFVGHAISIKGRRLAEVFDAIAAQRALELSESPSHFDEGNPTPFIETIAIVSTQER